MPYTHPSLYTTQCKRAYGVVPSISWAAYIPQTPLRPVHEPSLNTNIGGLVPSISVQYIYYSHPFLYGTQCTYGESHREGCVRIHDTPCIHYTSVGILSTPAINKGCTRSLRISHSVYCVVPSTCASTIGSMHSLSPASRRRCAGKRNGRSWARALPCMNPRTPHR